MVDINFNELFALNGGYVRKILAVKESEKQVPGHRYGMISKSLYYTESERDCVSCCEGDCFVVKTMDYKDWLKGEVAVYSLYVVDTKAQNNLRLLAHECRVLLLLASEYPYPENVFVEKLIRMKMADAEPINCEFEFNSDCSASDLLKNGWLKLLPCKPGQTVYSLSGGRNEVHECKVKRIVLDSFCGDSVVLEPVGLRNKQYSVSFGGFGKKVFLTRKDAETAYVKKKLSLEAQALYDALMKRMLED